MKISDIHAKLAIRKDPEFVRREEYLDFMTFRSNERPLFTELFGPLVGVKEEWAAQDAAPGEIDFSAFRYRDTRFGLVPAFSGWLVRMKTSSRLAVVKPIVTWRSQPHHVTRAAPRSAAGRSAAGNTLR